MAEGERHDQVGHQAPRRAGPHHAERADAPQRARERGHRQHPGEMSEERCGHRDRARERGAHVLVEVEREIGQVLGPRVGEAHGGRDPGQDVRVPEGALVALVPARAGEFGKRPERDRVAEREALAAEELGREDRAPQGEESGGGRAPGPCRCMAVRRSGPGGRVSWHPLAPPRAPLAPRERAPGTARSAPRECLVARLAGSLRFSGRRRSEGDSASRRHSRPLSASRTHVHQVRGVAGAEAVVHVHHGNAGCARIQHGEQRREAAEVGAVADAGRHGDHRPIHQAAHNARQRALEARDHHDGERAA